MLRLPIELDLVHAKLDGLFIENDELDLIEEIEIYEAHQMDVDADKIGCYWLRYLDIHIPYRLVNLIIERIETSNNWNVSEYGQHRDCEDFVVKTDWFQKLDSWTQEYIREDFYLQILLGIRDSFDRKQQWKYFYQ